LAAFSNQTSIELYLALGQPRRDTPPLSDAAAIDDLILGS